MEFLKDRQAIEGLFASIEKELSGFLKSLSGVDNLARYKHGKLTVAALTFLVPTGATQLSKLAKLKEVLRILKSYTRSQLDEFLPKFRRFMDEGLIGNLKFKVDNTFKSADELAGVLINGEYRLNPTAKNVTQLVKNPSGTMKLDQSAASVLNGKYMYVVDEADNIIIGTRAKGFDFSVPDGKAPHPTLIGGVDPTVKTAGIIEFRAGKIYKVDNFSGHYKPSAQSLQNAQPIFSQKFTSNNFADNFQGFIPFTN